MRSRRLHRKAGSSPAPDEPRRRRLGVLFGAGSLALVLATTGIVAALAGRSSRPSQARKPSAVVGSPSEIAAAPAKARPGSGQASTGTSTASMTAGLELADGTYPTYIRGVDVHGARITVDVIQLFEDQAAVDAAVEDGQSASEAKYLYVYIRNQNSRLRTLPVAGDVRIDFVGTCESPPNRDAALRELAERTSPFNTDFYYDITVTDGVIHSIAQHLAIAAC